MIERPIGTCSFCGGPVFVPSFMVNPVPCCRNCGATAAKPYGPEMAMVPRRLSHEEIADALLNAAIRGAK
jgi:hypothetical protein